jgi:hypothetical protein
LPLIFGPPKTLILRVANQREAAGHGRERKATLNPMLEVDADLLCVGSPAPPRENDHRVGKRKCRASLSSSHSVIR